MRVRFSSKCPKCEWNRRVIVPKRVCPDCGSTMTDKADYVLWILFVISFPILYLIDLAVTVVYWFRGEKIEMSKVMIRLNDDGD